MAIPPVIIQFQAEGVPNVTSAFRSVADVVGRVERAGTSATASGARARGRIVDEEARNRAIAARRGEREFGAALRESANASNQAAREQTRVAQTAARERLRIATRLAAEERRARADVAKGDPRLSSPSGPAARLNVLQKAKTATPAEQKRAIELAGDMRIADLGDKAKEKAAQRAARERIRAYQVADREEAKGHAAGVREFERDEAAKTRTAERFARDRSRAAEREDRRQSANRSRMAQAVVGRGAAAVNSLVRGGVSMAHTALQFGGGYSVADAVQERMKAQGLAADIANSGYMPNGDDPRNKTKRSSSSILTAATQAGTPYAYSQQESLEGLSAFVGKSGDLSTGLELLPQLAQLARATGSSFSDVSSAAGDIMSQLDGVADKSGAVMTVMRGLAGQGKLGAVEMKDLATQMAKLAAASGQVGGDAVGNMLKFGMLAQEARAGGGAASATQAATSATGIVNTLKTPARIAAFKEKGIDVFDKKTKMLRSPEQIILESLEKTKGDPEEMKKLFANVTGEKATLSYANTYRKAEAGEIKDASGKKLTGREAVQQKFDRMLVGSSMSEQDVSSAASDRMGEADMQFQKSVLELKEATSRELIPAFTRMVPELNKLIPLMGDLAREGGRLMQQFTAMASANPLGGLGVLIGAAMTKELAAAGMGAIFEKALATKLGSSSIAVAGAALAITSAVMTIQALSSADSAMTSRDQELGTKADRQIRTVMSGKASEAEKADARQTAGDLDKAIKEREANKGGGAFYRGLAYTGAIVADTATFGLAGAGKSVKEAETSRKTTDEASIASMKKDLADLTTALKQNTAATQKNTGGPTAPPTMGGGADRKNPINP